MKKHSIMLLLALSFIFINICTGQGKLPPLSVGKIANIDLYLSKLYNPDTGFVNHACINTIVFIRFKVENDKVDPIGFSANCPSPIKEALKKALLATNSYFNSSKTEKALMKNMVYLLPVIFYYQLGCSSSQIVQKESETPKDPTAELMKYIGRDDLLHKSLDSMLGFDDGKSYTSLKCILINPVRFSAYD